jgi:hypothetical protein
MLTIFVYPSSYIYDTLRQGHFHGLLAGARRTSCDSVEFPHPSIRMRASWRGMSARSKGATSRYVLNQSNAVSSADSLR